MFVKYKKLKRFYVGDLRKLRYILHEVFYKFKMIQLDRNTIAPETLANAPPSHPTIIVSSRVGNN